MEMSAYIGATYKISETFDWLNPIINNNKIVMRQWTSNREATVTGIKPAISLDTNIDFILGQKNINRNGYIRINCTSHPYDSVLPEDWYTSVQNYFIT